MRILIGIVAIAAALWSGYWFVGSSAKHKVMSLWLEDRKNSGWVAEYEEFEVVGFPNRFDSRFKNLKLGDPRSGVVWAAPFFNVLALSYQPNHIIAVWPDAQSLSFPGEVVDISSTELRASIKFEADTKLAVSQSAIRTSDLRLTGSKGWETTMKDMEFSTRQSPSRAFAHDVVFSASAVKPTKSAKQMLDSSGALPEVIDRVFLDLVLGFDAAWDRIAVEEGYPRLTAIDLNNVNATWGVLDVQAKGALSVRADGILEGNIDLKIKNWRRVLAVMTDSGAIDQQLSTTLENGLTLLTALTGSPDDVNAPLSFSDGSMSLGPIPLGQAPRLLRR